MRYVGGPSNELQARRLHAFLVVFNTNNQYKPAGRSERGYGDDGVGCRRSVENLQLVVRSNREAVKADRE